MNDDLASPLAAMPAPDFLLPWTQHARFALQDLRGHPAVLLFYPGDWDPISAEQLRGYQAYLPELERFDAALVGISLDSVWSHTAFSTVLGLQFPLLSDSRPRGAVARAYQVYREGEDQSARALFVLDPAGVVRWSRTYPTNLNPGVHGILSALEALQLARAPPEHSDQQA